MKYVCVLFVAFVLVMCSMPEKQRRLFIAGDSTAQTYDVERTLMRGWGQEIQSYLDSSLFVVVNHAKAGRSTKSFISESRWDSLISQVREGDVVVIQFGHNDTSSRPERYASEKDYKANLRMMIEQTRSKGAEPVLITSIVMRTFADGNLVDDRLKKYPVFMKQVAREEGVSLIDANTFMRDTVLLLGPEKSKDLYLWIGAGVDSTYKEGREDDTHMCEAGARAVAEYIASELKEIYM